MSDEERGEYLRSPVPSDRDLWPGERPFTAWGQFSPGSIDLRVFDQGVWWVDVEHQPHLLSEMSTEYLSNVIGFLLIHAERFHLCSVRRWLFQEVTDIFLLGTSSESLAREIGAPDIADLPANEWLESTPLMRALRRELRGRANT